MEHPLALPFLGIEIKIDFSSPVATADFSKFAGIYILAFQVALVFKNWPANEGDIRDMDLIPVLGRFPGKGHGIPFLYACLENPMDRGAWEATHNLATKQQLYKMLLVYNRLNNE